MDTAGRGIDCRIGIDVERRPVGRRFKRARNRHGVFAEVDGDRHRNNRTIVSGGLGRISREVCNHVDHILSLGCVNRILERCIVSATLNLRDRRDNRIVGCDGACIGRNLDLNLANFADESACGLVANGYRSTDTSRISAIAVIAGASDRYCRIGRGIHREGLGIGRNLSVALVVRPNSL